MQLLIRTTDLIIESTGEIVILSHDKLNPKKVPLYFLMEQVEHQYKTHFLSFFLDRPIVLQNGLTVKNLVSGLHHWFPFLNTYCLKSFEDYLHYFDTENPDQKNQEKCVAVHLKKFFSIKKHNKIRKGIDLNEIIRNYDKYKIETDSYNIGEGVSIELETLQQDGTVLKYGADPCIDVNFFKDAKIILDRDGIFTGTDKIINPKGECITENKEQDDFLKKKYGTEYFAKINVQFTLKDLIDALSSLFYFKAPLTQEKQQENFEGFCEDFEEIEADFLLNIERKPQHEQLFDNLSGLFEQEKNRNMH